MQQPLLLENKAASKMSSSIIEIFSSNPIPSEKTFLSELKGSNFHPLRHSLKRKKKIKHQNSQQRPHGKQWSPTVLIFIFYMSCIGLPVFIFIFM